MKKGMSLLSIKKKAEKPIEFKTLTEEQFDKVQFDLVIASEMIESHVETLENCSEEIQELKSHIVNLSMKLWKVKEQACSCTQMPW